MCLHVQTLTASFWKYKLLVGRKLHMEAELIEMLQHARSVRNRQLALGREFELKREFERPQSGGQLGGQYRKAIAFAQVHIGVVAFA